MLKNNFLSSLYLVLLKIVHLIFFNTDPHKVLALILNYMDIKHTL